MKNLFTILLTIASTLALSAQKMYIYPKQVTAPRGSYQTVTVVVNGVNDKTVTWNASGGRLVGANPCVVNEPCTVGLFSDTPGTFHLKATSNANPALAADSVITFTDSPTPVSSHPRLLLTQSMLPGLRSRANSHNVTYRTIRDSGLTALKKDNEIWSWSCKGGSGQPSSDQSGWYKEGDAYLFAFLSMVAPGQEERNQWGCYGRDIWVYVMKQVLSGKENIRGNHWSDSALPFTLTTDWLMAGNYLSADDQKLSREFLAEITKTILGYIYGTSLTFNKYNSPEQFAPNDAGSIGNLRIMGNNYVMSKLLFVTAAALTFNDTPADDPDLTTACHASRYQMCPDYSPGSLHAYFSLLAGDLLYRMYAHLEAPDVSAGAYAQAFHDIPKQLSCLYIDGSPHSCFGDGRGGESSEGSWYQYSFYKLRYTLNMLHTAGYDDPLRYGPQISLGTSSWWDMKALSDLEFLTGFSAKNGPKVCAACVSPAFGYLTTGDSNTYYREPGDMHTEAAMLVSDSYVGRKDRTDLLRWLMLNSAFGGPLGKSGGCTTYCGFNFDLTGAVGSDLAIDVMIATPGDDPTENLPQDPRPSMPSDLFNASFNQHTILRSSTGESKVLFSTYCPNTLNDHEHEFCGRFDIYSNGEYITKGRTEFDDYNELMSVSSQSNMLSILNVGSSDCVEGRCFMYPAVANGGQFSHGQQQGFNLMTHSELPVYAAFLYNDTPAYNGWWIWHSPYNVAGYNDVAKASRSMIYLRDANQLVYYDRAVTHHAAAKAVYAVTTGEPSVNGKEATWLTRSGKQRAFFTSLLPDHANVSSVPLIKGGADQVSDWEPQANLKVDSGEPTTVEFLSVLEWGPSSMQKTNAKLVKSSAGQNFDGALVGSSLVMFMRDWPTTFTGVTYPASGATTQYVSDLQPNMPFAITGDGVLASAHSDSAGVLTFPSSGTGTIHVAPAK